jgi:hypothetical protein
MTPDNREPQDSLCNTVRYAPGNPIRFRCDRKAGHSSEHQDSFGGVAWPSGRGTCVCGRVRNIKK